MMLILHLLISMLTMYSTVALGPKWKHTIYVDPFNGNDTETCVNNGSIHDPCATLKYLFSKVTNSTEVVLVRSKHIVHTNIRISNCHYIAMTGINSNLTTITCPDGSNAGLEFVGVVDLQIVGIEFENCGCLHSSTTREISEVMALFRSAVYILNSSNITIESAVFINNRGVGLVLFDVSGSISIMESNFSGNLVPESERGIYNGGGGLYIEHTYCTPGLIQHCNFQNNPYSNSTTIDIFDCHFNDNHGSNVPNQSSTLLVHQQKTNSTRLGSGGGITITLKGLSHQNKISISGCTFKNNSAGFGGGLDIQLQDYVTNNDLQINKCQFINNKATNGGGGMFMGIFYYEGDTVYGNQIMLNQASFTDNQAQYGGGYELVSSRTKSIDITSNSISFTNCSWHRNNAMLGAAVLLVPEAWSALTDGQLPVPLFKDCQFYSNKITTNGIAKGEVMDVAEGAFYSSTYTVNISSSLLFIFNKGTAFSAIACSINILHNTTVTFWGNSGIRGGALALLEFASLHLFPGSDLIFDRNNATDVGGAIYAAVHDTVDFYYSKNCFIRYHDLTIPQKTGMQILNFGITLLV